MGAVGELCSVSRDGWGLTVTPFSVFSRFRMGALWVSHGLC